MDQQIIALATKYKELKKQSEETTEALKKIDSEWLDVETQLLEAMVNEGVKSVSLDGLGMFSMRVTNYLSVNAADKEKHYEYLQDSGNGGLLKMDVNPRTLTAFLKGHFEEVQKKFMRDNDLDEVQSRDKALEFLKSKGVNYFTKRDIALKG